MEVESVRTGFVFPLFLPLFFFGGCGNDRSVYGGCLIGMLFQWLASFSTGLIICMVLEIDVEVEAWRMELTIDKWFSMSKC